MTPAADQIALHYFQLNACQRETPTPHLRNAHGFLNPGAMIKVHEERLVELSTVEARADLHCVYFSSKPNLAIVPIASFDTINTPDDVDRMCETMVRSTFNGSSIRPDSMASNANHLAFIQFSKEDSMRSGTIRHASDGPQLVAKVIELHEFR
jgi:hypothetical protein